MASMEEEGQQQTPKCFSSDGSSCNSGFDSSCKAQIEDEGWQEGEFCLFYFFPLAQSFVCAELFVSYTVY